LASVGNTTPLRDPTRRLAQPLKRGGRQMRTLNAHAPAEAKLIEIISQGKFTINGFRNRDLRRGCLQMLTCRSPTAPSRRSSIAQAGAHGLIKKVRSTHRYQLARQGRASSSQLWSLSETLGRKR
jgi:hypothetical protein